MMLMSLPFLARRFDVGKSDGHIVYFHCQALFLVGFHVQGHGRDDFDGFMVVSWEGHGCGNYKLNGAMWHGAGSKEGQHFNGLTTPLFLGSQDCSGPLFKPASTV